MGNGGQLYQPQGAEIAEVHLTLPCRLTALHGVQLSELVTVSLSSLAYTIWLQLLGPTRLICRASMPHCQVDGEDWLPVEAFCKPEHQSSSQDALLVKPCRGELTSLSVPWP